MLIDNYINIFRDTGCAYAIDGKQGGRLLSPLQQVDYRDFAANPQDWGTSWADGIGASEGWEVDVAARYYTVSASTLIFGRGTGSFMMQTTASGVLCGFFCVDLQATSTWTVESAFTNKVIPVVWSTLVGVTIKREIFPIGEFHALVLPDRIGRQADEALDEGAVEDVCRHVATRHFMVIKFVDIAIIDIAADFLTPRLPEERE